MPWARSFCPFRACCFKELLSLQSVLKPLVKLYFLIEKRKIYLAAKTSTSTRAPFGNFSTATAERAGYGWLKNSA